MSELRDAVDSVLADDFLTAQVVAAIEARPLSVVPTDSLQARIEAELRRHGLGTNAVGWFCDCGEASPFGVPHSTHVAAAVRSAITTKEES